MERAVTKQDRRPSEGVNKGLIVLPQGSSLCVKMRPVCRSLRHSNRILLFYTKFSLFISLTLILLNLLNRLNMLNVPDMPHHRTHHCPAGPCFDM